MVNKTCVNINPKFIDHPIFNETICGTNFGFLAKRGYYNRPEVKMQPELMKKAGVNWATVNMNICQTNYFSDKIYIDFEYSTGELELNEIVKRLHDNGIKVLFKPCLTLLDGAWMGLVNFPSKESLSQIEGVDIDYWKKWFASFESAVKYYSDLAERIGMDALILGAEYFGTEGQNMYWEKMIEIARELYSGPMTYEFTFASRKTYDLEWIKKLDFLSYSYYPPARKPKGIPVNVKESPDIKNIPEIELEDMINYLEPRKKRITSICKKFGDMPIAFTEYGVRSARGCTMQPFNYLWDTPYDGNEQANYMEASFQTFSQLPQWMGLFWWKWDETQIRPHYNGDPNGERGFTIQGKPAEAVFKKWARRNKNYAD